MLKRVIVVGASSGIGAALVRRLAQEGCTVAAVARRQDALDDVCAQANMAAPQPRAFSVVHDVTDVQGTQAVFDALVARMDGLDLIIYCAGSMPKVGADEYDIAVDAGVIEVNLIGAMAWLNLAAQRFRVQGGGCIVGIGSVAGDRGRRGNPAYAASKAGLHTWLEALRNRLSQHGVRVVTVKPGPVATPMTRELGKLPLLIEADRAAAGILAATRGGGGVRYVPLTWWPIMSVIKGIPSVFFRRMDL
ncbi:MAG: decaprenylphospho-beta-D-erythro-pentofuranosid-2-ulose 2-reductase [Kiritimatiellia bacterium]|jgi:decaprenylphospho-beta-D-erythro-pentofuranosid-2-ulose 2-reductase